MSGPDFTVRDEAHLMSEETLAKTTALPLPAGVWAMTTSTTAACEPLPEDALLKTMDDFAREVREQAARDRAERIRTSTARIDAELLQPVGEAFARLFAKPAPSSRG